MALSVAVHSPSIVLGKSVVAETMVTVPMTRYPRRILAVATKPDRSSRGTERAGGVAG